MDIPASPPTFSFPRITRRRRHTNAGPAPSLPQQAGGSQPTSQPQDANPLSTTASSIAPIISLVRSGPFSPTGIPNSTSPTTGPSNSAANQTTSPVMTGPTTGALSAPAPPADGEPVQRIKAFRIRLVPHLESSRSLHFDPIVRDVKVGGPPLRVGRFTDRATGSTRNGNGLSPNDRNSDKVAFRSKVVSRAHAELWAEENGKFFLKDTSSSSGTFINHMRLSPPGQESLAHLLKDGDVIQLGVDYQGGAEEMYRCVKIKVEVGQGREWQGGANAFNTAALKQVRTLQSGGKEGKKTVGDCCICLFAVGVCQSLFIAPCSHAFHYKCIRPMLELHHPGFACPLCRTFADLEADVEYDAMDEDNENNVIDDTIQKLVEAGTRDAAGAENGVPLSGAAIVQFLNQPPNEAIHVDSDDDQPNGHQSAAVASSQAQVDEDEQVEDALEMDYAEEDDDAMGSDNSLPPAAGPISVPDEFGGGGASNGNAIESTMTPARSQALAQNNSSVAPVAIGSSRADQAQHDGVNGTTPSNNVLFAGTHPLLDGISPSPESLRIDDAASTMPLALIKDPVDADFVDDAQRHAVMGGSSGGMDGDLTGTIVGSKRKR